MPDETKFLPPGPGGEEGGKRAPGSRWSADPWDDEDFWKQEPVGQGEKVEK
jgi:hypothetical protein